jgi:dUTP pyrophosphatase
MSAVLSRQEIYRLLKQEPPLVESYLDLDEQVQPNGIDLTLREVALLESSGKIAVKNAERQLPGLAPLVFDGLGFIDLIPGIYLITYNEIVHLPNNVMAPQGFRLQQNARVVQLVFLWLSGETEGYQGAYQNENID